MPNFVRSAIPLFFKNYSLAVSHLQIKFKKIKSFLRNTNKTDRNCVNEQNAHRE